jgi:flagellar biosynthesis/type III secretory pathway protein FliH
MQALLDVESKIASAVAEGMEKGLEQGIAQGLSQGLSQGVVKSLLTILTARYGILPEEMKRRIDQADCEQLEQWLAKAMTAKNLDELF